MTTLPHTATDAEATEAHARYAAVRDAVEAIETTGYACFDLPAAISLSRENHPDIPVADVISWLRFLVAGGRILATDDGEFVFPTDYDIYGSDIDIHPQDPPEVAALADELDREYDHPVPYLPADDPVIPELHRRTVDAIGNIRAADTKASVLLAVLGFAAGPLGTIDHLAALAAVGAVLAVPAVLLGLVLLPRTTGRADRSQWTADMVLEDVAERAERYALADELQTLDDIADRKYALIRRALIAMAAVIPAYVAAYLAAGI